MNDIVKNPTEDQMKVGLEFIFGRSRGTYTTVSIFEDDGRKFYVARYNNVRPAYSNVFAYLADGTIFKHV